MPKQIVYPKGFDKDKVLAQVQSEYLQSFGTVQNKRQGFLDDLRIYNDSRRTKEKVRINLAFSNVRSLMAMSVRDQMDVQYIGGGKMANIPKADNWNKLARNARSKMGMTKVKIETSYNKFVHGVGITILDYDGEDITACGFDTKMWMPDPNGWLTAENFRFMGFKKYMNKQEMEDLGFQCIKDFRMLQGQQMLDRNPYTGLMPNQEQSTNWKMRDYAVYDHRTQFNGEKYLVTVNDEMTCVARLVKFSDLIPKVAKLTMGLKGDVWPCTLSYWNAQYGNPYGVSVIDLAYDKQVGLSKLVNLGIKRATRISLGPHKFYNKRIIGNRTDLTKLDVEPKWIGIDPKGESLANAVFEPPIQAQMPADNTNYQGIIEYWSNYATSVGPNQSGMQAQGDQTATEANLAQDYNSLINAYGNLLDIESEKELWFKWYLMAKAHYKKKQIITILNTMGQKIIQFDVDDLDMDLDDVIIKSTYDVRKEDIQMIDRLQLLAPYVQQFGTLFSNTKFVRDLADKILGDPDTALMYIPYLWEEIKAQEEVPLLNNSEKGLDWGVQDIMGEEHDAFIAWYNQAAESSMKTTAIKNRYEALKEKQKAKRAAAQGAATGTPPTGQDMAAQQSQSQAMVGAKVNQGEAAGQTAPVGGQSQAF